MTDTIDIHRPQIIRFGVVHTRGPVKYLLADIAYKGRTHPVRAELSTLWSASRMVEALHSFVYEADRLVHKLQEDAEKEDQNEPR